MSIFIRKVEDSSKVLTDDEQVEKTRRNVNIFLKHRVFKKRKYIYFCKYLTVNNFCFACTNVFASDLPTHRSIFARTTVGTLRKSYMTSRSFITRRARTIKRFRERRTSSIVFTGRFQTVVFGYAFILILWI